MTDRERAQEMESSTRKLRDEIFRLSSEVERLLERNDILRFDLEANKKLYFAETEQNRRYREAVEKAIHETYEGYDTLWIVETLEKALEELK